MAVLFVGLFIGAFAPKAAPAAILSTVGLILFFYGIGIGYGKSFVEGLTSPSGSVQQTGFQQLRIGIAINLSVVLSCSTFKLPIWKEGR